MSAVSSYRPCAGCDEPCGCPLTTVPSGPRDDRAALIAALPGVHSWGDVVDLLLPVVDRIAEARAVARAQQAIEPFRELFAGGPDTACRTVWRQQDQIAGIEVGPTECVEVPMLDLRDAFARADALGDPSWVR